MTLYVPKKPQFNFTYTNANAAVVAGYGTSITPGASNTFGSYTEVISDTNVTLDCYGIHICLSNASVSAQAKDLLVTIGIDTAGGTSYVDFISNLIASCASSALVSNGGHNYYFPVKIPAGTAIAAKASVNNATAGTIRCAIWLFGAPQSTEGLVYGTGVETIGAVTATSAGTAVTPGTSGEGSWTSLGTTTKPCFAWQYGMGVNDGTMAALSYGVDLSYGNGTNQITIDSDKRYISATTESLASELGLPMGCNVPVGGALYGRISCSGTPDSNVSMAAYGVY